MVILLFTLLCYVMWILLLFYSSARHNEIETVEQDALSNMKRAFYIHLDSNLITTIEANTFKDMKVLREVWVAHCVM